MIASQRPNQAIGFALFLAGVLATVVVTEGTEADMKANQGESVRQPRGISHTTHATPAADLTGFVHRALHREIAHIQAKSDARVIYEVDPSRVRVLQSPLLAQMFSRDVFVPVTFRRYEGPALKGKKLLAWASGSPASTVFAFDKDTGESVEMPGDGYQGFARLLAKRKVLLKSDKDAQRIWDAFCAIFEPGHERDAKHIRVSPDTWRLNQQILPGPGNERMRYYFYELHTNVDGTILAGRIKSLPAE